jgi:hypothetical protein
MSERKVVVYHSYWGCETGCCGHIILVDDEEVDDSFDFRHPYEDTEEAKIVWAKEFVRKHLDEEHAADLDWENCYVSDD